MMDDADFQLLEEKYLYEKKIREEREKYLDNFKNEIEEIDQATNYNGWVDLYEIQIITKQRIATRQDGNGGCEIRENKVVISDKVLFVMAMESYIYALMEKYGLKRKEKKNVK